MKKDYTLPNGQKVSGEEVEFEPEKETFNSYILQDGTRLKVKYVTAQIARLDAWAADGTPIYMVNGQLVISAEVPEHLKKKGQ